jgi:DNA repair exonuclease SbcCD ATPase subunit
MSGIGKAFIVLAILGSLATAGGGFFLAQKKSGYAGQLAQVESSMRAPGFPVKYVEDFKSNSAEPAASIAKVGEVYDKAVEELNTANTSLTETKSTLSDSQAKVSQLTTEVTSAKKELEEKVAALSTAEEQLKSSSEELAKMKDELGGRVLGDVLAESRMTKEKLEVLESEKTLIEDTLMQKQAQIEEFKKLDRLREAKAAPLELSGKVVALNKAWNFVVLDVGEQNQLVEGVDLTVYRGDSLIGKVRTVSVDAETAIADILPEWSKSEIQVGDQVLF